MGSQNNIVNQILGMVFLPVFAKFVSFAWGQYDPFWLVAIKRVFLWVPVLSIVLGYWVSMFSIFSVLLRIHRKEFVTAIFVSWWDLGRAILGYWGGVFKFLFLLLTTILGFLKLIIVGIWVFLQDLVAIPFRVFVNFGNNVLNPGLPWIAVFMTLFWCVFESIIFAYVLTPLVMDLMGNITGQKLSETFVRFPLFLFMLFIVLGSYSVLSSWADCFRRKDIRGILKIGVVELVAAFVEVMFLYREFVDAIVPWFAQYSSGEVDLGMFGTLAIATITWIGIRAMSWFLFAAAGTPTLLAIIQGTGVQSPKPGPGLTQDLFKITSMVFTHMKSEVDWGREHGQELLNAFILPPVQIVAASLNFCSLFVASKTMFDLPIKNLGEVKDTRGLLRKVLDQAPEIPPPAPRGGA